MIAVFVVSDVMIGVVVCDFVICVVVFPDVVTGIVVVSGVVVVVAAIVTGVVVIFVVVTGVVVCDIVNRLGISDAVISVVVAVDLQVRGHASDPSINVTDHIMPKQSHIQHSRMADTLLYDIPRHDAPCSRLSVEFFVLKYRPHTP